MLVLFAFPIADLRSFTGVNTHRLTKPTIPADPGGHFIRDTGMVRVRRRGGSQVVAGEDLFCRAKRACVLPPDQNWSRMQWNGCNVRFYYLLRRYFRTGDATSRFEIGFRAVVDGGDACDRLPAAELIGALAATSVRVTEGRDHAHQVKLIAAGDALAAHFRIATTQLRGRGRPHRTAAWWCRAGEPLVVIELDAGETVELPSYSVAVEAIADRDIDARFFRLSVPTRAAPIGCWVVQIKAGARMDRARQLRMHLVRVHGEVQCLQRIVQAAQTSLKAPSLSAAATDLIAHLDTMTKLLEKTTRHGTRQQDILDVAYQSHHAARAGELSTLLEAGRNLSRRLKQEKEMAEQQMTKATHVSGFERMLVAVTSVFIVALVAYLVIRNEPIADQNLVVMVRILISLAVSVLGAVIPGFLNVSWKGSGLAIRAGGALALFVLTFALTPQVLPSSSTDGAGADSPAIESTPQVE